MENNNKIKAFVFMCLVSYMFLDLLIEIPDLINNIVYGIMAIIAIIFLIINRKELGVDNPFKKKDIDNNTK